MIRLSHSFHTTGLQILLDYHTLVLVPDSSVQPRLQQACKIGYIATARLNIKMTVGLSTDW